MRSSDVFPTDWAEWIVSEYRLGRSLAILFDFDGTLTPIVGHPKLARLSPQTHSLLSRIKSLPEVCLGVISGRELDDVRTLIGLDGVYYSGSGGLEVDLKGNLSRDPLTDTCDELLDRIHEQLLGITDSFTGTWVERKPGGLAIHFRALSISVAEDFCRGAVSVFTAHGTLRHRIVAETIEVTPAGGWDKGTAVEKILAHASKGENDHPLPVYFGDAENDREAMEATTRAGGVAVGVGPHAPTVARIRIADEDALATQLAELVARLESAVANRIVKNNAASHGRDL